MALVSAENVTVQAKGFGNLPVVRQVGLMLGLALSVALGVNVAMWSQSPNYSLLSGDMSAKDLSQVTQLLDQAGIEYQIERGSVIMVPAEKLHEARMKMATQGLSPGAEIGYDLLEKDQGFGSSSFLQKARYNRALEGELAQSIGKLKVVESARVHLAIPKQSAFARKKSQPAASVVLNLYPGRVLNDMQVSAIVNMVASSVPELETARVTVIDQKGRLLSSNSRSADMLLSSTQFDYTHRLEERYVKRIIDIISPMTGIDGVKAEVVVDMDFTAHEQTKESYLPDQKVIRSEQVFNEESNRPTVGGIPGALSNQPPVSGSTADNLAGQETKSVNSTSRAVRNYELDKVISHTRQSPTSLKRISVAVVVDYREVVAKKRKKDKKAKVTREPLSEEEIARITSLVKEAVGLNEERGDTIIVVNTPFQLPEEIEPLPDVPIWEQAWILQLLRQLIGGLVVLFIAFGILRPILRNLAIQGKTELTVNAHDEPLMLNSGQQPVLTNQPQANEQQLLEMATSMAKEDPKRVAQVLNNWVASDG